MKVSKVKQPGEYLQAILPECPGACLENVTGG